MPLTRALCGRHRGCRRRRHRTVRCHEARWALERGHVRACRSCVEGDRRRRSLMHGAGPTGGNRRPSSSIAPRGNSPLWVIPRLTSGLVTGRTRRAALARRRCPRLCRSVRHSGAIEVVDPGRSGSQDERRASNRRQIVIATYRPVEIVTDPPLPDPRRARRGLREEPTREGPSGPR